MGKQKVTTASVIKDIWGDLKSAGTEVAQQSKVVGRIGVGIETIIWGIIVTLVFLVGLYMTIGAFSKKDPSDDEIKDGKTYNKGNAGVLGVVIMVLSLIIGLGIYKSYVMTQESGFVAGARGVGYATNALRSAVF